LKFVGGQVFDELGENRTAKVHSSFWRKLGSAQNGHGDRFEFKSKNFSSSLPE
jgi:hypothetical protein